MKILTIAIPSYNSMDYMRNCIESLLPGGEDVEILIVDDGSKDETPAIADEYEAKYPGIIRAIHQENGGHGWIFLCIGICNLCCTVRRSVIYYQNLHFFSTCKKRLDTFFHICF